MAKTEFYSCIAGLWIALPDLSVTPTKLNSTEMEDYTLQESSDETFEGAETLTHSYFLSSCGLRRSQCCSTVVKIVPQNGGTFSIY